MPMVVMIWSVVSGQWSVVKSFASWHLGRALDHLRSLPKQIRALERRPVGAGQLIDPIFPRKGGSIALGIAAEPDAAALAGAHAAGHGALDGDLALDAALSGDVGHTLHHRLGAARVDDGR